MAAHGGTKDGAFFEFLSHTYAEDGTFLSFSPSHLFMPLITYLCRNIHVTATDASSRHDDLAALICCNVTTISKMCSLIDKTIHGSTLMAIHPGPEAACGRAIREYARPSD
jgi:hypothetical protein